MSAQPPIRVLFVDDEESIRVTLPQILRLHGFEVTSCATVPEALECIQKEKFDLLLADLNIGQPGDGFTVVSAMRRTQPQAVTIIITGFPAFETALEAIRAQVDDYVVKPARIESLLQTITERLRDRRPHAPRPVHRVAAIVRQHSPEVVAEWLLLCDGDIEIASIPLSQSQRSDYIPVVLAEIVEMLEERRGVISDSATEAAAQHGRERHRQGYTLSMLLKEGRYLRRAIFTMLQQHLLEVNISFLISDLIDLSENLDVQIRSSVEAFLDSQSESRVA